MFNRIVHVINVLIFPNFSGIEALAKVDGAIPEYGKGFLEKVKEYKEGEPIEKIAASM